MFVIYQVKPLIWVESVIERHAHSRVEYMIKVSSFFYYTNVLTYCKYYNYMFMLYKLMCS